MKRDNGRVLDTRKQIGNLLNHKFGELFRSSNPTFPMNLEGLIQPVLKDNNNDNGMLEEIPWKDEIKRAIWGMPSLKAPGLDRLQGIFYKKYWDIVGASLVEFVRDFFIGKSLKAEACFAHKFVQF